MTTITIRDAPEENAAFWDGVRESVDRHGTVLSAQDILDAVHSGREGDRR